MQDKKLAIETNVIEENVEEQDLLEHFMNSRVDRDIYSAVDRMFEKEGNIIKRNAGGNTGVLLGRKAAKIIIMTRNYGGGLEKITETIQESCVPRIKKDQKES